MAMCSGCEAKFSGKAMAHCAVCHQTFSTVGNFDRHRKKGVCTPPEEVGLVHNDRGTWKMPGERDLSELQRDRSR